MAEGNIGLAEPSTITKSLRSVTQNINSSVVHQEVMTLGGAGSSLQIATVLAAPPASTEYGLVVRIAGGPSSAVDLQARVNQGVGISSAADGWLTRGMPASTLWASSAGFHFDSSGAMTVRFATAGESTVATISRQVGNSSAADFMPVRLVDSSGTGFHGPANPLSIAVTDSSNGVIKTGDSVNSAIRVNVVAGAAAGSTLVTVSRTVGNSSAADFVPVRIVDSSGTGFLAPGLEYTDGSTASTLAAPGLSYVNGSNTTMRMVGITQPLPVQFVTVTPTIQSTTALVNVASGGGVTSIQSSVAAMSHKVFAFSVTSTHVNVSSCAFVSSAASEKWGLLVGSQSSGVTGANLAVSPPGFLFKTAAGEALGFSASSTGNYRVSISFFTEA